MRAILSILILALLGAADLVAEVLRDESGTADLRLGACAAVLADQDGDGDDELLVGAPGYQASGQDAGRVYLWFGGTQLGLNADRVWTGQPGEQFGHAVAAIGDVDGDGVDDFAVGAPFADNAGADAGRVYIFYGGDPIAATADLVLEGRRAGERFGWSIAALGDFNGDGRDDFAVGAPTSTAGAIENGAAYVYYGRSGDPHATPDLELAGSLAYDHFGWSLAGADRFLGGSARCLAVGAPSTGSGAGTRQGAVHVFQGTTSPSPGPNATADLVLRSSAAVTASNAFGYSVAGVGDFDGGGAPDLAVGIPSYSGGALDRGRVEIFFGGAGADAVADRYADGAQSGDRCGWSVAAVGDVTGSVLADVVLGSPYDNTHGAGAGRAFVWAGGSGNVAGTGSLPAVDRQGLRPDTEAQDLFGSWCAGAGDFDGDGQADFVVTAPYGNLTGNATAGWVRLVDSSGLAVPVLLGAWRCAWTQEGTVQATLELLAGLPAIERAVFTRRDGDGAARVLHDGAPRPGSAVAVLGSRLQLLDRAAADLAPGAALYDLVLDLADGTQLARASLPGPDGPPPAIAPAIRQDGPNPFNPRTTLGFRAAPGTALRLDLFDLQGRRLATLFEGAATGTWQQAVWDGRDERGGDQAAGVYLVRLRTGAVERTLRVALVR